MKEKMVVHDIGVGFAFATPHPGRGDPTAMQNLVEPLTKPREPETIMVIKSDGTRPVNSEIGHQGEAD